MPEAPTYTHQRRVLGKEGVASLDAAPMERHQVPEDGKLGVAQIP